MKIEITITNLTAAEAAAIRDAADVAADNQQTETDAGAAVERELRLLASRLARPGTPLLVLLSLAGFEQLKAALQLTLSWLNDDGAESLVPSDEQAALREVARALLQTN